VEAGGVLLKRDLTDNEGGSGRPPDGYRAMTIKVAADSLVGVRWGDRVDLFVTFSDRKDPSRKVSKLFVQNLKVLALNPSDRDEEAGLKNVAVVTFEVTPMEAEKINWVASQGMPVRVALRNATDKDEVKTPGFDGKPAE
jgi:Flp pilus assembly protein CpaB